MSLVTRRARSADTLFRRAFVEAPVAAAIVDADGRFVEVNRGLEFLLGYPIDELLGMTFSDIAPPDEAPIRIDELGREQQERCILGAGREPHWVAVSAGAIEADDGKTELYVVQLENIADRKRSERKLRRLADHDSLTWLLNRRSFLEGLRRELLALRATGGAGALLVLDLDNFKQVNDTSGHPAGDTVLRATSDVLRRRLRTTDVIGRLGGDEFAAVLLDVTSEQAHEIAADLTQLLREIDVDASIGVALFDDGSAVSEEELLARADRAMYAIKSSRRT